MADDTKIEWCDSTFNPWIGCTKVGPGCDHCYAEADFDLRKHRAKWGTGNPRSRTSPANWKKPLQWDRQHAEFFAAHGRRRRVFCASLADVFDNEVPDAWRMDLFSLIAQTPTLDWLLLTKRIGNVNAMSTNDGLMFDMLCDRVWLGATVVNQEEADRDIPKLLKIPAHVRWLSMEPLLGPVRFHWDRWLPVSGFDQIERDQLRTIDWIVAGGESGPKARPMYPDWTRSIRDQCAGHGVPFLFKQWGEFSPDVPVVNEQTHRIERHELGGNAMYRAGKHLAGRVLDGVQHDGYPEAS